MRFILAALLLAPGAATAQTALAVRSFEISPPETGPIQCLRVDYLGHGFQLVAPPHWSVQAREDELRFRHDAAAVTIWVSFAPAASGATNAPWEAVAARQIGARPFAMAHRFEQPTGLGSGAAVDFEWTLAETRMAGRCVAVRTGETLVSLLLVCPRDQFAAGQPLLGAVAGSLQRVGATGAPAPQVSNARKIL